MNRIDDSGAAASHASMNRLRELQVRIHARSFVEKPRPQMRCSVLRVAQHAATHLRAWFLDERTRMNPNLQFAQAIHGRVTGRGTGIIDTIHLVEVARAIEVMEGSGALSVNELKGIKQWFADYLQWMTTHQYGIDEREAKNNHGTCWVMQVAEFARLTNNQQLLAFCRDRFKTVLLPNQMAADGSFPQEYRLETIAAKGEQLLV